MSHTIGSHQLGFERIEDANAAIQFVYDIQAAKPGAHFRLLSVTRHEIADAILDTLLNFSTQGDIFVADLPDFIDTIVSQIGEQE